MNANTVPEQVCFVSQHQISLKRSPWSQQCLLAQFLSWRVETTVLELCNKLLSISACTFFLVHLVIDNTNHQHSCTDN